VEGQTGESEEIAIIEKTGYFFSGYYLWCGKGKKALDCSSPAIYT
jgi:hypothetical protein